MKKLSLLFVILAVLCFAGCEPAQEDPGTDPSVCLHNNLGGDGVEYRYGECCEDPVDVYVKCVDCGEYVYSDTIASDRKCDASGDGNEVVREPSCTVEGIGRWECWVCHTVYEPSIPVIEHEYMWFWGQSAPSCVVCGLASDVCAHEYEQTNTINPSKDYIGKRVFTCKYCGDVYQEYFDQYGDFELHKVTEQLRALAQEHGFKVVLGYAPTAHHPIIREQNSIVYRNTNSKEAAQRLMDMGNKMINTIMLTHFPENNDPSEFYLWLDVTYADGPMGTRFYVTITFAPSDMDFP